MIEDRPDLVEMLQARGVPAVLGNGISQEAMEAAGAAEADLIFVTVPDGFEAGGIVELARKLKPNVKVYARAHSDAEVAHLQGAGRGPDRFGRARDCRRDDREGDGDHSEADRRGRARAASRGRRASSPRRRASGRRSRPIRAPFRG